MLNIATNIFRKLSDEDKKEIQKPEDVFGKVEISEYIQKGLESEEVAKFIFQGFIFRNLIEDVLLWESFQQLFKSIFNITIKKVDRQTEVQIWVQDTSNPASLNVVFSIKQEEDIKNLLITLRTKLEEDIFSKNKQQETGKILWVAFDKETSKWLIKTL